MFGPIDFWMWTSGAAVVNGAPGPHPLTLAFTPATKRAAFTPITQSIEITPITKTFDWES